MATLEKRLKCCKFSGGVPPTPSVTWPVSGYFKMAFDSSVFVPNYNLGPGITVPVEQSTSYTILSLDLGSGAVEGIKLEYDAPADELFLSFTGIFSAPGTYSATLEIYNSIDEENQVGVCYDFVKINEDGTIESKYLDTN